MPLPASSFVPWTVRWTPLAMALLCIGYLFLWRVHRFRRRFGRNPIHLPSWDDQSVHAFLSHALVVFVVAILALGLFAGISPDLLESLDPLYARRSSGLLELGILMMLVGAVVVITAQEEMAHTWRIGIDEEERTDLITSGIFRLCRNPIYLGLELWLAGFACTVPGFLSITLAVTASVLFQVQVRLEEAYLFSKHREAYAQYCGRVGRFLPWTGRWRPRDPAPPEP